MAAKAECSMLSGTPQAPGEPAPRPFQGPGLFTRAAPFAVVAAMAEASLALPPGTHSRSAVIASLVLLLLVPAAFLLPWARLPAWTSVLVPLAYTGSVLALILAAGSTSGVGIVVLIPLVWTALFHRRWESGCIVAAIVAVEVIVSLTQTASDAAIIRRVLLWGSLGALISIATHGLRDRIRRSQEQSARLQDRLRELTVLEDRDRIAADLQDRVIPRIFTAGLTLQGAATLMTDVEVRRRVEASVENLDEAARVLRQTIFGLERLPYGRGLRQGVLDLCGELSPVPEVSFSGPVDGALPPCARDQLLGMLREALGMIGKHAVPARIGIAAGDNVCLTVVESWPGAQVAEVNAQEFGSLRESARQAGGYVDIEPIPGGTRFVLKFPLERADR